MSRLLSYSLISGILLGGSWPVNGFTPLIFISLIPLLYVEDLISKDDLSKKNLRIFFYSYLAFLTWNISTTWWIVYTTLPGAIFANVVNSSFYSIIFLLYSRVKRKVDFKAGSLFLITFWITFEKFHLNWEFSWPWLNLGNVFSEDIHWIQWYEYTGTFGGSLWVLLINIGLFEVLKKNKPSLKNSVWIKKLSPWLIAIAIPITVSLIIFKSKKVITPSIEVLLLQPNIDPYEEKYERENAYYFDLMASMTKEQITNQTRYIIAPETYFGEGLGASLDEFTSTLLHHRLDSLLQEHQKIQLIAGIQSFNIYRTDSSPTQTANFIRKGIWVDFYNSALKMEYNEKPEFYHKSKLVVGVENMPYKRFFRPLLGEFLLDLGGTVSSRATQNYRSVFEHQKTSLKVGPVICYESIYGEFVTEYARNGAHFFTIITNDGWWGNTAGHKQLLSYARLRAIENRRDIVRSANTGISAIINGKGEITDKIPYNSRGVLKGKFAPQDRITFYAKYGDYIARWSGFISVLFFLIAVTGRLKKRN